MPDRRRHVHEDTKEASQVIRVSAADLEQAWLHEETKEASQLIRVSAGDPEQAWPLGWNISKSASQLK